MDAHIARSPVPSRAAPSSITVPAPLLATAAASSGEPVDAHHSLTTIAGRWSAERCWKLPYGRFVHHSAESDGPLERAECWLLGPVSRKDSTL
jgi:hypothetical protein